MSSIYKSITDGIYKTLANRFRSKPIIDALDRSDSLVSKVLKNTCKAPVFIKEPTDNKVSRLNFTSWLRVIDLRDHDYDNKGIGDAYLIHELLHMNTMPFGHYPSYDEWKYKMILNEQRVSFLTEVELFFDAPTLRDIVNLDVIWADRFLDDPYWTNLYKTDPKKFRRKLMTKFQNINGEKPHKTDMLEKRTNKFNESDDSWCQIWRKDRHNVETHMQKLYTDATLISFDNVTKLHIDWLTANTTDDILFRDNAQSFYDETKRLNREYQLDNFPVVVITGANRGIGLELAKQYSMRGWTVYAGSRNIEDGNVEELRKLQKNNTRIHIVKLDVTNINTINKLIKTIDGGCVDLLINNAGIKGYGGNGQVKYPGYFNQFDENGIMNAMDVNCIGAFNMSKYLLPNIEKSRHKSICNITSEVGELDDCLNGQKLPYRLSKGAVNNLTMTVAGDCKLMGNGVNCFAVKPGWVRTDMTGPHAPQDVNTTVTRMIGLVDRIMYTDRSGEIFNYNDAIVVD